MNSFEGVIIIRNASREAGAMLDQDVCENVDFSLALGEDVGENVDFTWALDQDVAEHSTLHSFWRKITANSFEGLIVIWNASREAGAMLDQDVW